MFKTWLKRAAIALGVAFIAIQFVPYGRNHTNPPVVQEPTWSGPDVRALAVRACYDCHSNETIWPWYSNLAPVSWLVQRDTFEGRQVLNFSEWNRPQPEAHESAETVVEGEMPPVLYRWLHPKAVLSPAERQRLIDGLTATFGGGERGTEHKD